MTEQTRQIKTLFCGLSNSRVAWYRCFMPALYIGADWMGIQGSPPRIQCVTSFVQGQTKLAKFDDYDLIVLQQVRGKNWRTMINNLRAAGKVVLYEIDDYVHGIKKASDHDFREFFQKGHLQKMEMCMRACDGIVCSTDYIARRYKTFTSRTWVCENGLDMARYRLTPPPRGDIDDTETVTIMWSGATGHVKGVNPWIEVVERVMRKYPHVCFASIGQGFAEHMREEFGGRVVSVPFAALETYPAAMMLGDIALAPAGTSAWYRGKSTLRAMEAAACGIPVIAASHYEDAVLEGHSGFVCDDPGGIRERLELLIEEPELRKQMGVWSRKHAEQFDMKNRRYQWEEALVEAYEECHA